MCVHLRLRSSSLLGGRLDCSRLRLDGITLLLLLLSSLAFLQHRRIAVPHLRRTFQGSWQPADPWHEDAQRRF